jgi:predicted TIM-barrel fold metal-dependent hydrolase
MRGRAARARRKIPSLPLKQLPPHIVDFHVHLFPDRLFEAIWRQFVVDYGWAVLHQLYAEPCIAYLREHGVAGIVYSNYAHRQGVAPALNDWNLRLLDAHPDLYCFAAYHPADEQALPMVRDLFDYPQILGVKLQLLVQRFHPEDERLFPLYEEVIERGKRVLFHVGTGPVGNVFVGVKHFRKVLDRYPDLPATVAHMGALEYDAFTALLPDHPRLCLDTSFAFLPQLGSSCPWTPERFTAFQDRVLYGSDFPNVLFPREDEINTLLGYDLPQTCYDRIFRENALRLITEHSGQRPRFLAAEGA